MFYLYHKKSGDFANKSVRKLGRNLQTKKIGHTGILDPLASGLMLIATESDTRTLEYIENKDKTYIASATFNLSSDTLDITGNVVKNSFDKVLKKTLENALDEIKKTKTQQPPIYSAKKINGKKAYEYARNDKFVEIPKQKIEIYDLELLDFNFEKQTFEIKTRVSEGTYIRTLLYDIAKLCNNICVMKKLIRTNIGTLSLEGIQENELKKIDDIRKLFNANFVQLNPIWINDLLNGRTIKMNFSEGLTFIFSTKINEICCVGFIKDNIFHPKKVFKERLNYE
ncbi:tRNA pseudouridine(55) synthase TruB [Mycoplasma leonicaptivi]|uniref:tRNA pseudouridine(55) synthase TruB n=1 Tax=Mycoplasma leonicaptivi TaxID=36742 RepID=UPI00048369BC|nr:tRNA pseudouridine(55) synthase TruB [Mycoplasma leonicaptivi]